MANGESSRPENPEARLPRRSFLKGAGAAGIAGLAATVPGEAAAAPAVPRWDKSYDVVVIGSGAAGLPAAIAARDKGATVLLVEKNWDVGGRAMLSGGSIQLGGGNRMQIEAGVHDTPDQLFLDWTGSEGHAPFNEDVYGPDGLPLVTHQDREIVRAFADHAVETFDFLEENGVEFARLQGVRGAGDPRVPRQSAVVGWPNPAEVITPNIPGSGTGSGLVRPLERSARAKGVEILLLHRMTSVHREQRDSGRVLGVTLQKVDRWNEPDGPTVNVEARKGVILCTGGPSANVAFRRIYDPRLTEEYGVWAHAYTSKDGDGEMAALAVGASLWTAGNQLNLGDRQVHRAGGQIGTRWNGDPPIPPGSPAFFKQGTSGLLVSDWQDVILVKEHGKRFADEVLRAPLGSVAWRKHINAALAWTGDPKKLNGGGPVWAIFDSEAAAREEWRLEPPYVDPDGGYFFVGDTLEELAAKLIACPYQWRPMPSDELRRTVERYNGFVDAGVDEDFQKPTPTYRIEKPPFYAAWATPTLHDVYAGVRIDTSGRVMDLHGEPIPGLYAAGENAGGMSHHGLAKGILFGRLAGHHAATLGGS